MTDLSEQRHTFRQILHTRYILFFLRNGCRRIGNDRQARRPLWFLLALGLAVYLLIPFFADSTIFPLDHLYRTVLVFLLAVTLVVYVWYLGTPPGYLTIMQNMVRTGLSNSLGETPLLLSRTPIPENKRTETWEFESRGVPFSAWEDYTEKIESACDLAIIRIDSGENERKVLLTVIPHPGPWPTMIEWNTSLLDPSPAIFVLGENRTEKIPLNLAATPHILTAGRTSSGKSVLQKSLMLQCLLKGMRVILVDYKRGVDYTGQWQNYCEIITADDPLLTMLDNLCDTMNQRLDYLKENAAPNIDKYNLTHEQPLTRICVFFDEIVECLDKTGARKERKEKLSAIEASLSSLARLGRAAGIHLFLSTQRGSADVLNGQIRNNVYKICGSCDENLSILTLGNADAAKKIPSNAQGRFLTEDGIMFQGYYSDYPDSLFDSILLLKTTSL